MKDLVFLYACLFPCKIGTNIKEDVLDNNELPSLVEHNTSSFPENMRLFKTKYALKPKLKSSN